MEVAVLFAMVATVCGLVLIVWRYLMTTGRARTWQPALLFVLLLASATLAGSGLSALAEARHF